MHAHHVISTMATETVLDQTALQELSLQLKQARTQLAELSQKQACLDNHLRAHRELADTSRLGLLRAVDMVGDIAQGIPAIIKIDNIPRAGGAGLLEHERLPTQADVDATVQAMTTAVSLLKELADRVQHLTTLRERELVAELERVCAASAAIRTALEPMPSPVCPICMDSIVSRFVVPCGHTFCSTCCESARGTASDGRCFVCKGRVDLVKTLYHV